MSLEKLIELSRLYGGDPEFVLAGGGNTSYKDEQWLWVKASGSSLADIGADGFAVMERARLDEIWTRSYPQETAAREAAILADLMNARRAGESKRPSVETFMHGFLPGRYVVHTHPALVNGLTCAKDGEKAARELFGERAVWVPTVNPGYILALTVRRAVESHRAYHGGRPPEFILMQNHGLVVAADEVAEIRRLSDEMMRTLRSALREQPDFSPTEADAECLRPVEEIRTALAEKYGFCRSALNRALLRAAEDPGLRGLLMGAYTPDHIVYAGFMPLYVPRPADAATVMRACGQYEAHHAVAPKTVLVQGLGVFGCGGSAKAADNAALLFQDAVRIAVYAGSFGGARFLPPEQVEFIRTWEVEQYRSRVSA